MCTQEVLSIDKEKHLRRRLKRYLKDEWAFPAATVTEKPPTLEEHIALADLLHADRIVLQQVSPCLLSN
jgi:UDP-glucose 6-dehydrogenase